jgi:hypothetical protein
MKHENKGARQAMPCHHTHTEVKLLISAGGPVGHESIQYYNYQLSGATHFSCEKKTKTEMVDAIK